MKLYVTAVSEFLQGNLVSQTLFTSMELAQEFVGEVAKKRYNSRKVVYHPNQFRKDAYYTILTPDHTFKLERMEVHGKSNKIKTFVNGDFG